MKNKKLLTALIALIISSSCLVGGSVALSGCFLSDGKEQTSNGGNTDPDGGDRGDNLIEITGITFSDDSVTYDGQTHSLEISGNLPQGVSVSYSGNNRVNAGVYSVTAIFTLDAEYETVYKALGDMTATLVIEKAEIDVSAVVFSGDTVTCDGNPHSIEVDADTLPDGITGVTYSCNGVEGNTFTEVGAYDIIASFSVDANHLKPDDKQATLTINATSPSDPDGTSIISYIYGGSECAAVEWEDSSASSAKVYYKLSSAADSSYIQIDSQLIRQTDSSTARADIVGLKGGQTYDIKIASGDSVTAIVSSVEVSAYDRSGYAHFNYTSGVGAYNDDGTLKSDAQVVYVTEETKNTVTAKLGSTVYTGIVSIMEGLSKSSVPVAIRIIGSISAATWNKIDYNASGVYNGDNKLNMADVIGANGESLFTYAKNGGDLTQAGLIKAGFNSLNTSVYSELKGLSSKIVYSSGELDSCWNNCSVSGATNVTVEGIGEDAEIFQWGMTWSNCNSVEVRNIIFDDYTEDACSFEGGENSTTFDGFDSNNIWVHGNTFNEGKNYWDVCPEQDKHEGDGATDFKKAAYITIAYNHYYKNHKTGLIGGSDGQTTACVTFHHNYYENCTSRLTLARQANMHMYNNYYYGSTGTNMSIQAGGYAFIENCYFENADNPVTTQDGDSKKGVAKIYNCIFSGKALDASSYNVIVVTDRTATVSNDNIFNKTFDTDSSAFYYDGTDECSRVSVMLTAEQTKELVPALAGVQKRVGSA